MAAVQLDDPGRHPVQEGSVMGDGHDTALEIDQQVFQPFDRVEVQVVGGLVQQQHVGPAHQRLGQRDPLFRAAGQCGDHGILVQVQPMQGLLDPLLPVPAVLVFDRALQFVQVSVAGGVQVDPGDDVGDSRAGGLEHGRIGFEHRLLRHVRDAHPGLQLQNAVVGFFHAGQDLQHRRLAGAVAPDQPDALAGLQ